MRYDECKTYHRGTRLINLLEDSRSIRTFEHYYLQMLSRSFVDQSYVDTTLSTLFFFWQIRDTTTPAHNHCQFCCCCKMCVCVPVFALHSPYVCSTDERRTQNDYDEAEMNFYVTSCLFYYSLYRQCVVAVAASAPT